MGQIIRIDLKGQGGLRSYTYEGNVGEAFLRGLARKRREEAEHDNLRQIMEDDAVFPRITKSDYDPAA
jgi:hypothetical protein